MKIGIEGQRLFRKKKHGMDVVALELVKNLQELDKKNEYFVFIKPDEDDKALTGTNNFHIIKLSGGFYPYWEQVILPKAAKKYGCDILHCTSNTAPVRSEIPLVVTLHDIIYLEGSYFKILTGSGSPYQKFGNVYRRLLVPGVVRNAQKIITVSKFEEKRISDFFKISGTDKICAIYNGVSSHFKKVTDELVLRNVREKYHLPEKYFLFLGNTDPKKNTKGTIKAYSDFIKQSGKGPRLVLLDYDRDNLNKILEEINDKPLINNILIPGYIQNTDLPAIYSQCEIFLYPSLRESFGIPMLEAMRCGAPVITGNTSSMPEVAGSAAFIIDPFNTGEITAALNELSTNQNKREELIQLGFQRSELFSWRNMAKEVLDIYYSVNQLNK